MSFREQSFNRSITSALRTGLIFFLPFFVSYSALCSAAEITSIDFKGTGDPSEINIQTNGPVTFDKQENPDDKQIIIELKGATLSKGNSQKIDTSSFNSKISLISPYQVDGQTDTVRVVLQLREAGSAEISQNGNLIQVKVPSGVSTGGTAANPSPDLEVKPSGTPEASPEASTDPNPKKKDLLNEFADSQKTQQYMGKPITLQVRDVDVSDVLRLVGEASGFNMVIGEDVKGKVTLSLVEVPWDQALDLILHTMHLGAERSNNILRIASLENITKEKTDELKVKALVNEGAPRVTRVFPISYATLSDLKSTLMLFATSASQNSSSPGLSSPGSAAIVQQDDRTNSIIVRDLPENIERIKKLIEILDTQTPQVMIEAKIIEATESFSKTLSGNLGIGGSNQYFATIAGGDPVNALLGSASLSAPSGTNLNGTFGVAPTLSFIPGLSQLNALLTWGEAESQVKVISSPKTVVLNKQKASVVEGTPVAISQGTTTTGGAVVSNVVIQQANIGLDVTPTVTNDGSVLLKLKVTRDVPLGVGIGNRNIDTTVLVESGTTLVIGGVYTMSTNHTASGLPFLRKIPLIGALFGSEADVTSRSELFFFITPRVLNEKPASTEG